MLQRRIVAPRGVDAGDEGGKAVGAREVPLPELVFLAVEILFGAGLARRAFEELERRAVDPVVGRQRRGKHEPRHERRAPAVLQILGQDVRRVRPAIGAEVIAPGAVREFGEIGDELRFRVAPREVRIRLREAEFREAMHHLRSRERFGQEDHVRMLALDPLDHPFPESKRLRMRVVDAEDAHAFADPEREHGFELAPQLGPVRRFEMERIDVLVFLRRVLRVLHRSVRAPAKPLTDAPSPTDDPARTGTQCRAPFRGPSARALATRRRKSSSAAELRMERRVAALGGADRPRAADVLRGGRERIVAALAPLAADRMDRRQVQDVEAHLRDVRQPGFAVAERAVRACVSAAGAREHLVPRGKARAGRGRRRRGNSTGNVVARLRSGCRTAMAASSSSMRERAQIGRGFALAQPRRPLGEHPPILARGALRRGLDQRLRRSSAAMRRSSASTRRAKSWRHDRKASTHAMTV